MTPCPSSRIEFELVIESLDNIDPSTHDEIAVLIKKGAIIQSTRYSSPINGKIQWNESIHMQHVLSKDINNQFQKKIIWLQFLHKAYPHQPFALVELDISLSVNSPPSPLSLPLLSSSPLLSSPLPSPLQSLYQHATLHLHLQGVKEKLSLPSSLSSRSLFSSPPSPISPISPISPLHPPTYTSRTLPSLPDESAFSRRSRLSHLNCLSDGGAALNRLTLSRFCPETAAVEDFPLSFCQRAVSPGNNLHLVFSNYEEPMEKGEIEERRVEERRGEMRRGEERKGEEKREEGRGEEKKEEKGEEKGGEERKGEDRRGEVIVSGRGGSMMPVIRRRSTVNTYGDMYDRGVGESFLEGKSLSLPFQKYENEIRGGRGEMGEMGGRGEERRGEMGEMGGRGGIGGRGGVGQGGMSFHYLPSHNVFENSMSSVKSASTLPGDAHRRNESAPISTAVIGWVGGEERREGERRGEKMGKVDWSPPQEREERGGEVKRGDEGRREERRGGEKGGEERRDRYHNRTVSINTNGFNSSRNNPFRDNFDVVSSSHDDSFNGDEGRRSSAAIAAPLPSKITLEISSILHGKST